MSPDYKNGYNSCVEDILNLIQNEINLAKSGDFSINDSLRKLRIRILAISFGSDKKERINFELDKVKRESNFSY